MPNHEQKRQRRGSRTAGAGSGWKEAFLCAQQGAGTTNSVAESVARGFSVLQLHDLMNASECKALLDEATAIAERVRVQHFGQPSVIHHTHVPRDKTYVEQGDESGTRGNISTIMRRSDDNEAEPDDQPSIDSGDFFLPPAHCLMLSNSTRIRLPVMDMLSIQGQVLCLRRDHVCMSMKQHVICRPPAHCGTSSPLQIWCDRCRLTCISFLCVHQTI